MTSFGPLLRLLRRQRSLTQEGLAELAGFSPEYVRKLEGGTRRPSEGSMEVLAQALELDGDSYTRLRQAWKALPAGTALQAKEVPCRLPAQVSSFIGRERELAEVSALVADPSIRLLTLTGPGGIGKTRLALEAARQTANAFPDGVFLVELARLSEPEQVAAALCAALDLADHGGDDLSALADKLARKRLLLVIDNLEHLLPAAGGLLGLLSRCPAVTALITSRISVGVPGEHVYEVSAMATPAPGSGGDNASRCDSVSLFVARAVERRHDFRLETRNRDDVFEICRRLSGMPLAIELAAARVRTLSPRSLLESIATLGPIQTLNRVDRLPPERHASLDHAMEWSYRLLSPTAQAAFRRASIFRSGFTAEALAEVCEQPLPTLLQLQVELVESSLVQEQETAAASYRFSMLEPIRDFGASKLDSAERLVLHGRHGRYFMRWAHDLYPSLNGSNRSSALDELEADRDNLAASIERLAECGDRVLASRLAGLVWPVWHDRGFRAQGRAALAQALPAAGAETGDDIRALRGAGVLAAQAGELSQAESLLSRALHQCRKADEPVELVHTLRAFFALNELRDDAAAMTRWAEEALTIAERLGDDRLVARTAGDLAVALVTAGRASEAEEHIERSVQSAQRCGLNDLIIVGLGNLAWLRLKGGDPQEAELAARQAYEVGVREGGLWPVGVSALNLGGVIVFDRPEEGLSYLREAVTAFQELAALEDQLFACELLAVGHSRRGSGSLAATIWSASSLLRTTLGLPGLSDNREQWEQELLAVRQRLSDKEWDEACRGGRDMSLGQLVELALR